MAHTFNYVFKHPILVTRELVFRLALHQSKLGRDDVERRRLKGGYSLAIFNEFVLK